MAADWRIRLRNGGYVPWVVAAGIGLRLFHYGRNPPVWHDEAALIVNVLSKSFRDLLGPLTFAEAGPPLFLWGERAAAMLLGDGTPALRLIPVAASCLALVLTAYLGRRLFGGAATLLAVLLLAFSNRMLWHSCEAKPYAVEALAAVLLPAVYHATRERGLGLRLGIFALLAPPVLFVAYPGCFVCGGLLLALLAECWRERRPWPWLGFGLLVLVVGGSFAVLVLGPVRAQRSPLMDQCWVSFFPPWHRPWAVPGWAVFSSLDVARYCFEPTGHVLGVLAVLGAVRLWQRGKRRELCLLLGPGAAALTASAMGAYPWGGARVEVFLAPALALLAAVGMVSLRESRLDPLRLRTTALAGVVLLPVGLSLYRAAVPWPRSACGRAATYVLQHREAPDFVLSDHWEYYYYFRELGDHFRPRAAAPAGARRLWVVISEPDPVNRALPVQQFPRDRWRMVDQREFFQTSVYLLSASGPAVSMAPGQSQPSSPPRASARPRAALRLSPASRSSCLAVPGSLNSIRASPTGAARPPEISETSRGERRVKASSEIARTAPNGTPRSPQRRATAADSMSAARA